MANEIHVYGENASGGHNVGLRAAGLPILITSSGPEHDAATVTLGLAIAASQAVLEQRDLEITILHARVEKLAAQRDAAVESLDAATCGRRRFNSPVLCVPHSKGEWGGAVWLLDPKKREGGFGLHFGSLKEVRAAHPELWIVGIDGDGILLDACVLPGQAR